MNIKRICTTALFAVLLLAMLIPLGAHVSAIQWSGTVSNANNGQSSGGTFATYDYTTSANIDWATVGYRFSVVDRDAGTVKYGTNVKDVYMSDEFYLNSALAAFRTTTPRPKSVLRQGYTSKYSTYTQYSTSTSNVVLDKYYGGASNVSHLATFPNLPSTPGGGTGEPTIGEWCQTGSNLDALLKGADICKDGTAGLSTSQGTYIVLVEPIYVLKIDGKMVALTLTEIAMYEYAQYRAGDADAYGKVSSGGINNILIMSNQKYPALLREKGEAGLEAGKFWITSDMVDIYNSNGSISSGLTSGKFSYTDRNGNSKTNQPIADTLSGQYILSPIYIITRGYGVGVAWDGNSTTPPENVEPYVLSVSCNINGVENSMFPNLKSSNGTSGYASYVQIPSGSGVITIANAGVDSYGYSAIFKGGRWNTTFALKAKHSNEDIFLFDAGQNSFLPQTDNTAMSIRDNSFDTSTEVRYYTIRFDANAGSDTVSGMPTQSYSFDGKKVWGYIFRNTSTTSYTRNVTISNPTRTGHTFKGWALTPTSTTGTKGTSNTTLTIRASDALADGDSTNGIVYYAIWEPDPRITVNCTINGSTANFPNITNVAGTENGYAAYIVKGSSVIEKAGTSKSFQTTFVTGTQYTVRVKHDQGSVYYLTSSGGVSTDVSYLNVSGSDATHTVKYYTIRFDPNAGSDTVSGMPTQSYSFDGKRVWGYKLVGKDRTLNNLPTPTRTGYTFKGWTLTPTSTTSKGKTTLNVTDNWAVTNGTEDGIVFYAIWEPDKYTVTVNCTINGSTANFPNITNTAGTENGYAAYIQHDDVTTKAGTGVSSFSTAIPFDDTYVVKVKDHYNRLFYFNSSKNIVETSQTLRKGANNTTFTANYYTIRFHPNAGNDIVSGMPTQSYSFGGKKVWGYKLIGSTNKTVSGLSEPTRTGYTFLGWSTNKDATASSDSLQGKTSVTVSDASATVDDDATNGIVVYAIWKRNNYTITVKGTVNGSAGFANIASSTGEGLFPAYIVVNDTVVASPSSTSSGSFTYTLSYGSMYQLRLKDRNSTYYCVDSSEEIVNGGVNLTVTGNKTYTVGHYTIRFDPNGDGVTGMPATSYTQSGVGAVYAYKLIGVDRNISPSSPTRTGYTFKGWALSSKGTPIGTTLLAVEDKHAGDTATDKADGIVYYAIWEPDNHTVTVDCTVNDKTANFPDIKSSSGNSGYASYIQNAAQDTTHATAGTGRTSYSYTLKTDDRYVIKVKDAQNRIFYLNSYGNVTLDESILTMEDDNETFTVGYYTIRFDPNAGNDTVTNMPTNSYGTIWGYKVKGQARTISGLPHPERAGYTFVGWSTTKSATGGSESLQDMSEVTVTDASAAVGGTEDGIVVYAIWEPKTYTVIVKGTVNGSTGFANIPSSTTGTGVYSAYIQVDGVTKAHPSSDTSSFFVYQGPYGSKYVLKIKDRTNNIVYESENTIRASNSTTYVDFFTIRFDPNGSNVTGMPATSYTQSGVGAVYGYVWNIIGRDVTVNNPTREGYTFLGWALSSKGTPIAPSSSTSTSRTLSLNSGHAGSTTTDKADGIVLYAIWMPNNYMVTVDCEINGSPANFPNIPNSTGVSGFASYIQNEAQDTTHAKAGTGNNSYSWKGTFDSTYVIKAKDAQTDRVFFVNSSGKIVSDIDVLKVGIVNEYTVGYYTIRFNDNVSDGSVSGMPTASDDVIYGYKLIGPNKNITGLPEPRREGYTFLGWSTNKDATSSANGLQGKSSVEVSDASAIADGDATNGIVIYAIWKPNTYAVKVDCNINGGAASFPDIKSSSGLSGYASYIQDVAQKETLGKAGDGSGGVYTVYLPYGTEFVVKAKDTQTRIFYVDANGNITDSTHALTVSTNHRFTIGYYTIRFDPNAGNDTVNGMPTGKYETVWGYKLVGADRVISGLSQPTRAGYTFLGWALTRSGATKGTTSLTLTDAYATVDGIEDGIVLYAIWEQETPPSDPTFTVTWVDEDGTLLEQDSGVPYGDIPSYDGETPTKESDERYDYIFDGWTPEITPVTGDITYTATYTKTPRTFTVTWVDEDGTVLEVDTKVPYGTMPSFDKSTPTKAATAQYTYTFTGWTPAIVPVTKDAVYTATYTPTLRTYTITWVDEDGTVLETDTDVPYGTIPSYDGELPTKEGDYQYTYEFDDWTPTVVPVTSDAVYEATYEPVPIKYNVVIYTRVNDRAAKPFANYGSVVVNGVEQSIGNASFSLSLRYGDEIDIRVAEYRDAALKSLHNKVVTGDMTFYIDYYTLTLSGDEGISKLEVYNSDGNTAVKSGPILKGTKVSPLATTAPTHIFDEWTYVLGTGSPFSAPEGNTAENPMKLYWPDITINERTSIKAHSLTHRIIFDKNDPDATGTMDDQYVRPGTGDVLDKNEFTNEGKFFVGWNTEPDGSGDYYSDEDYFVAPAGEGGTTTLYAQWGIRVIYNANTGNTSNGSYSIDADGYVCRGGVIFEDIFDQNTSKTIHSYIDFGLNKSGSTCLGWVYDLSDVEGSKISASVYTLEDLEAYADESGTVTLYAVWSLQTHKVDFTTVPANDAYGKVVLDNVSVDYITGVPHGSGMLQEGYKVTVTVAQDAVITVYFNNGTSKVVSLAKDETIVFTAAPKMNTVQYTYNFTSWSGAPLLVLNDVDVVATFTRALNTFKASFLVEPPDYGRVSKSRVVDIPYGSTVTYDGNTVTLTGPSGSGFTKTIVTATPAPSTDTAQYSFVGWEGPTSVVRNIEIVAHFKVNTMMDVAIVANDIIGNPKEGSVFTASANIVNLSSQHVGFYDGMVVVLEVVDANGNVVASYEKDMVPVPKMGSNNATTSSTFITTSQDVDRNGTLYTAVKYDNTNFVYFAIDANLAKGNYTLRWSLDFSESVVVEVGGTNNTDTVSVAVGKKTETSNTDRPDFSTDIPSSFKNKAHGEEQTSNSFSWYEIDIYYTDSQTFHAKRLTNGLDVVMLLTPENEAGLKQEDVVLFGIPDYVTRAGYGFSLHQPRNGLGLSINGYSGINASTVIAGANTFGIPEALMTYPEFDYSKDKGKSTTLMVAETSSGTKYLAFALAFPEYKDYQSNDVNDRFAHYIPMWYPDGEYTPVTYFSGAWSPLGEMTATVVQGDERVTSGLTGATDVGASETMMSRRHIFTSILEILGSLYDDIYITG